MNDRFSVHAIGGRAISLVGRMRKQFQTDLGGSLIGQAEQAVGERDFAIVVDAEDGYTLELTTGTGADSDMFRLYIVDDAMGGALAAAIGAIGVARASGNYFSAVMCLRPMEHPEERLQEPGYVALRCVADSLIIVPPQAAQPIEDIVLCSALALVRTAVPRMASLMCVDVSDIKHLLAGVVVALVGDGAEPSNTELELEALGRFSTWNAMPRAVFCAYAAPAALLHLPTAETVMANRVERLEAHYPGSVIETGLVPLAATPMTGNTELVTWIAFPQSEVNRCASMTRNSSLIAVADAIQ